jgi:NADPH:quinone reductase-like Zn-dependent oxidoreductase
LFHNLVFGADLPSLAAPAPAPIATERLRDADGWKRLFASAGLNEVVAHSFRIGSEAGTILVAQKSIEVGAVPGVETRQTFLVRCDGAVDDEGVANLLNSLLLADGHQVLQHSDNTARPALQAMPQVVVYIHSVRVNGSASASLCDRCIRLKALVEYLGPAETTLWIVTRGALGCEPDATNPVETGYWAFARTVANEFPNLRIRRADLSPALSPKEAAERIRNVVLCAQDETELHLDSQAARVVRIERWRGRDKESLSPARLERALPGSLDGLAWSSFERIAPAAGQVEIEVEATGLNFRDVMWALSILPDEALEDGFAGPCLGLECAGRILRVGDGVRGFGPGDRVVALARSAFATHVTVPAWAIALAPSNISVEAAAAIPVAFVTAHYALVTLARVRRNEWVLIHGGAGSVGLAALQIAQWRGARVIATAGSDEKRDLLSTLGVDHVLDSRTTSFVDDIREVAPEGVDVVLNSLSGEAMERGIGALRPFGRFLELGKRDYVANTHVGLRPFRRNLTYYGIDLDQLLRERRDLASKLFRKCADLFARNIFSPLPYCRFPATEVVDAFRLMQQSGHVGKIIVTPAIAAPGIAHRGGATGFAPDPVKTHLITGAFGGFGLETARWLARRGARHIVMLGRSGPATPEAKTTLAELKQSGVIVRAEACDVAEIGALDSVFKTVSSQLPPLSGIIHAAMVLEDATIANLSAEQFDHVARPKVAGVENLDQLTRDIELDYFVLFSSATTFIGNPGQAAYVAANAYMEGVARRRRQQGLPALAIAWGAIGDTGVLARDRAVREALASRIGVKAMAAHEALDLMADVLSTPARGIDDAVVALAPVDWSTARARLPVLNSPTYAALGRHQRGSDKPDAAPIDIRTLMRAAGSRRRAQQCWS